MGRKTPIAAAEQDLLDFSVDDRLGRSQQVFLLIKGFDQQRVVEKIIQRKGNREFGLTSAENPAERKYSTGSIVMASLDCNCFSSDTLAKSDFRIECVEPFGVAFSVDTLAYTSGSELRLVNVKTNSRRIISHDWLSFAHTVEYSADGSSLLTSSAGFDTVLEFNVDSGAVEWEWNAWDHGFNRVRSSGAYVTRSKREASRLRDQGYRVTYVRDPLDWSPEGIPTRDAPSRLNGASYDTDDGILLTSYHGPELLIVARDGTCISRDLGLLYPHGLKRSRVPGHDGYWVTNSGAGELLFLDQALNVTHKLSFSSLPADKRKARGFGEWIQTVDVLDAATGLFAAVDALRSGIHILDFQAQTRRFIPYPTPWRLHAAVGVPEYLGLGLARYAPPHADLVHR
jgi:hypothetical protein